VEGSDLCLPQWETGVTLCMYVCMYYAYYVHIKLPLGSWIPLSIRKVA
jgi:hypothetical protein